MAAIYTTRSAAALNTGRGGSILKTVLATVAAWNDARITRKSLSNLSARELEDIGLTYGDIEAIATRQTR